MRRAGYDFDERWFAAQFEFRFPKAGSIAAEGIELELRHGLEPWNVLAEESSSGGTVRTVDSSLERMQVKVSGLMTEGRYAVVCNVACRWLRRAWRERMSRGCDSGRGGCRRCCIRRCRCMLRWYFDVIDGRTSRSDDASITLRRRTAAFTQRDRWMRQRPRNGAKHAEEATTPPEDAMTALEEEANLSFPLTLDLRLPVTAKTPVERPGARR